MPGELVVIERHLKELRPRLDYALAGVMPATQLEQTILVSCERTPKLLECSPQSVLNSAMTFAVLGLPVDGATGQGFLIPFKGMAQAVIGYKGYNTLGARAGLTITAGTVREGDEFDWQRGTGAYVRHREVLGSRARIVAFWAVAEAKDRPPIVEVLSIDDAMSIRSKSPGAKREGSPWNDPEIGFPAMGEKSARRRLARSSPLRIDQPQYHMAARIEEAFDEQGKAAWATPERGVIVEGEPASLAIEHRNRETPTADALIDVESGLKTAAMQGTAALRDYWETLSRKDKHLWEKMKDMHFKPMAAEADRVKGLIA